MNFAVVNLGCKVNRVESDAAAAQLLAAGWQAAGTAEADVVVVNTCTVTGEAEKKTRKAVRRALRENARGAVLVTGCAAAIDAAAYEAMDARVRVVPKARLSEELSALCAGRRVAEDAAPVDAGCGTGGTWDAARPAAAAGAAGAPLRTGEGFPTRVGVKVQDGCDNACTYCIVHVARGPARSRGAAEVVAECVSHARAGVREIVLAGINLGSYCSEAPAGACDAAVAAGGPLRLAGLLRLLLHETAGIHAPGEPPCRFRISSIEPRDVDGGLVEVLAQAQGRVCRHLHLPLQAGSDAVLRAMARPYRAADYVALVDRLRAACPELSLSTDVIVGFPGETDDDFLKTLAVARRCRFSKIHVFPYSRREGTPAAARADQVPASVKAARARTLRALGDELREADYARRAGGVEQVLVEEGGRGMTESYYEIALDAACAPAAPTGALVACRLPESPLSVQ